MGRRTFKRPRQHCPLVLWNHGPDRHLTTSQASPIPTSTSPHLSSLEPFALQVSPLSKSVGPPRYNISSHVLARPLLHRSSPGHYNEKTSVLSGFAHSSFFLSLLVKRRDQHQGEVICHPDVRNCYDRHLVGVFAFNWALLFALGHRPSHSHPTSCVCIWLKHDPFYASQKHSRHRAALPSTTFQAIASVARSEAVTNTR